jgi:hypothetical protein
MLKRLIRFDMLVAFIVAVGVGSVAFMAGYAVG